MKKIFLIFFLAAGVLACSDDLSDVNVDTKNPNEVSGEYLFSNATKSLVDQMVNTNVNSNIFRMVAQQWTETTYIDEANFDLDNRDLPGAQWTYLYRDVLKDLDEAKLLVSETTDPAITEEQIQNQVAIMEILEVFTWHVLVDTFGHIPYSETFDDENNAPVYDDDQVIYADIISRLDTALDQLNSGVVVFGAADYLYGGDAEAWAKFGNSVKLRLALRLSDVDAGQAATMASEAIAAGVFTSHDDNAAMQYQAAAPNTNPIWEDLVQSGRTDFVAASTLVDAMNAVQDPRRDDYFRQNLGEGVYDGGTYGAPGNTHSNSTIYNTRLEDPTLEGVIMDYTEVKFLIAEAAARGFVAEDAATHYNEAVTSSILYWGGSEDEASTYLSQPEVSYDAANWQERIGVQKWISLYNRGFEAWSTWRLFNVPELPDAGQSGLPVPLRFTYPTSEATLNGANYTAAGDAMGGNEMQSRIFWDVE